MKIDIDKIFQQGLEAHTKGKLEEAEKLYREILRTEPRHPDANHNLGVLLFFKNKLDEAQSLFKFVTEINPDTEEFWISYINIFTRQKKFEEAEAISRKAIKLNTNFINVYFKLGFLIIHKILFLKQLLLKYLCFISPELSIVYCTWNSTKE